MIKLNEAIRKRFIDSLLKPKTPKSDEIQWGSFSGPIPFGKRSKDQEDVKFDTFSGPIPFGKRNKGKIKFDTFSGPIPFGKRSKDQYPLDEMVLGPTQNHGWGTKEVLDLHKELKSSYHFDAPEHRAAIDSYTGNGSSKVNNYLHKKFRGEKNNVGVGQYYADDMKNKPKNHEDMIKKMDEVVHKHKTPHAMTVYSGVPESPHHIIKAQGGYESGKGGHVVLPAYTSTSISNSEANMFSKSDFKAHGDLKNKHSGVEPHYNHMLKIHVPKGHPGAYVDHYSCNESEKEFILPRETRLHIHHEPEVDHKMNRYIWHAHIVDHEGNRIGDKEDLNEMADTPAGRDRLVKYTSAAAQDAVRRSVLHTLSKTTSSLEKASTVPPKFGSSPDTSDHKVVTGRDKDGKMIYGKEQGSDPEDESKKISNRISGISRASKILAKSALHESRLVTVEHFIEFVISELEILESPTFEFDSEVENAKMKRTMATYNPSNKHIWIYENNRNLADLLRSLAHEMVHHKQNEDGRLYEGAGEAGTDIENEANSLAGVLLRKYGQMNQAIYESFDNEEK